MRATPSPSAESPNRGRWMRAGRSSNGASGSSRSRFHSFLRMLNWRRDPEREMRLKELEGKELQLEQKEQLLEQREMQLEREHALLDWIESEIDLIEADLPSSSTPPPITGASSSAC